MKGFLRAAFGLLVFAFVAAGLGILVPRPLFSPAGAEAAGGAARSFYVISSAIHTDLAFPADDPAVRAALGFVASDGLDPDLPGARFLVVGWGSRAFYVNTPTWGDLRPGPLARAFTVDRAVMHVGLAGEIDAASPAVRQISVDEAAWRRLLAAVADSFMRDGTGVPVVIAGAEYGDFDRFYEAHGWFNALVGCNTWTAQMLRTAGLRTGSWTALPVFLDWSLELHAS